MEQFDVVATPDAEEDVERCYRYIMDHFKNEIAAESFLLDYEETRYPCITDCDMYIACASRYCY